MPPRQEAAIERETPAGHRLAALYRRRCGLLFGLLALALILGTLFAGDDIGLSNNGDFGRAMDAASLSFGERIPAQTYVDTYSIRTVPGGLGKNIAAVLFSREGLDVYPSIHAVVLRLSVAINLLWNRLIGAPMEVYRLGVLGALYAALYAAGIGALLGRVRLRRLWADVLAKTAALAVLCDVGYTAYFNSFYGEPLEHIALVWCAAMLVRAASGQPRLRDELGCALWAAVYGWAKFFDIPLAVLLLLVTEGILLVRTGRRRTLAWTGAALVLLGAVWTAVPGWMDTSTTYNAVFYGIVRDVDRETAEQYLADMGLPEELADFRDTNYYIAGVLEDMEARGLLDEASSVGKGELMWFYLTHPARLWQQARLAALHAGMIRPFYLANHGEGYPLLTYSGRMSLWSRLRSWLALDSLGGAFAVTAAAVAAVLILCWGRVRRKRLPLLPAGALLAGLTYAFLLPVILNGEGDLAKHMFAYAELVDLVLLGCFAAGLNGLCGGEKEKSRRLCAAVGLLLAAALVLPGLADAAGERWRDSRSHPAPEAGAYVTLGAYQGRDLTWLVTEKTPAGGYVLLCREAGILLPFDEAGRNDWEESSLRAWLNGPFLEGFTARERALLRQTEAPVILPDWCSPDHPWSQTFACSHIPALADRLWEQAPLAMCTDTVSLPGVEMAGALVRTGRSLAGPAWWLKTPYCPSDAIVRYVGEDGTVNPGDASAARSVRPVVEIGPADPLRGDGSLSDPFVLGS